MMEFNNVYDDAERASAYDKLEFPGTYFLAYRDLPRIIKGNVSGGKCAIDFGCGTGRSTRFLKQLGFDATGVDIADDMVELARIKDPDGDYHVIPDTDFTGFRPSTYDLILSVFTFDNIPTSEKKIEIFRGLADLLKTGGCIISLVSSPEIYTHEWASFTTCDFLENKSAKTGDKVKIIMTDVTDRRPVEDVICFEDEYFRIYEQAGLQVESVHRPLGSDDEPFKWVNETRIAPWVIYVLKKMF